VTFDTEASLIDALRHLRREGTITVSASGVAKHLGRPVAQVWVELWALADRHDDIVMKYQVMCLEERTPFTVYEPPQGEDGVICPVCHERHHYLETGVRVLFELRFASSPGPAPRREGGETPAEGGHRGGKAGEDDSAGSAERAPHSGGADRRSQLEPVGAHPRHRFGGSNRMPDRRVRRNRGVAGLVRSRQ